MCVSCGFILFLPPPPPPSLSLSLSFQIPTGTYTDKSHVNSYTILECVCVARGTYLAIERESADASCFLLGPTPCAC